MTIEVTESDDGLRLLRFGTPWVQGAMRVNAPQRLELEYAARMFAWLLFHDPAALAHQHLVTLGLGAGSLTRFAHGVLGMEATAVEIDDRVIEACRRHFLLPADGDRLHVVHADGGDFIARSRGQRAFDVVQVDAYDSSVAEPALSSEAFWADCRAGLRPGGTVAVNLIGQGLDLRACVARLRRGLQPAAVWQFPPTTEGGNVVVLAHCGATPGDDVLAARAAEIERRWQLPARSWVAMARRSAGTAPA